MPKSVPTPVAAALGLVPAVVDGVRRLPGKAVQLPVLAVSSALTALDTARREYDDLAERGERLVARFRGTSLDDLEDAVELRVEDTPLADAYDKAEDLLEGVAEQARAAFGSTAGSLDELDETVPEAEAPKGEPTPKATEPSSARVDTAATAEVVQTVEAVAARIRSPQVSSHDDLPLADYDHMTLGSLRGRLRSLDVPQLVQVREYEKAHGDRLPIVTMLDNRIAKLATDAAAAPSPGGGREISLPGPDSQGKVDGPDRARTAAPPHGKVRIT